MKKFICVGERYQGKEGEKTAWNRIGEIFEAKNGKTYCKLYHMPGQLLSIFEDTKQKPKAASNDLEPDSDVPW